MDKTKLKEILERTYQPDKWLEVLTQYFGAKKFHQAPRLITLQDNDLAEKAVEIGSFYTADERLIGIYQVNLTNKAWINKNRVGLRNLLRQVYKYDVDGALIVFIQDEKWRFSFVSEIRTEEGKKETEPKRFTYLFGNGECCRTAADRFDKLKDKPIYLNDLFDAFSVEKLNKEFFKSYKEYFELFSDYLAKHVGYKQLLLGSSAELEKGWKDEKAKPIRNFSKRLLGRIVFLHFLQKKGWMGVPATSKDWTNGDPKFLQNLFLTYPDKAHFHSRALRSLFFETLNNKRPNYLAPAIIGENIKIPYLNGGLFDKDVSFENDIDFPIDLFKNLLDFFEQYNFTIDENDPYDSEVGIDPEMLGHIFENLLEENKDKGAFYTPKEIVHYMCQESLIEYLHTQMPVYAKEDFETLVRNNQVAVAFAPYNKANEINEKLKSVKICDPAIGSGAFPMGLLKEIFECRRLLYGYLKTNDAFEPATIKKEIIQQNIYGVDIENGAVEIARLRFWLALVVDEKIPQPLPNLDYKIMQGNSLLEQFADIQLDKLINTGDEVMVQEKKQLTLGDDFEPVSSIVTIFTQANKEHLYLLINKYFDPDAWEEKTGEKIEKAVVKREINDFVEGKIHAHVLKQQRKLNEEISRFEKKWKDAGVKDFGNLNQKTKEYKRYLTWKDQLEQLGETEEKLIALQKTEDKPYFLWHLWFKDVFDNGGFDIIIGNPPYIKEYTDRSAFDGLRESDYYQGKMDIWYFFACYFLDFLKHKNGVLTFIATNNWTTNAGASLLRNKVVEDGSIIQLVDFGNFKIFESAAIQTMIMMFKRANELPEYQFDYRKILDTEATLIDVVSILNKQQSQHFQLTEPIFDRDLLRNKSFLFSGDATEAILNSILDVSNFKFDEKKEIATGIDVHQDFLNSSSYNLLGDNFKIGEGIFNLSNEEKELLNLSKVELELIKPFYTTDELSRYYGNKENKFWVIYTDSRFRKPENMLAYPNIKKHLDRFSRVITSDNAPYGLHRARNEYFFKGNKIISLRKCAIPTFTFTDFDCYVSQTFFVIKSERINLKYLTAILNSKLIAFWLKHKGKMQGFQYQVDKDPLLSLPIVNIQNPEVFEILVDYILYINENITFKFSEYVPNDYIIKNIEDVLNACVYELYFEEHMKEKNINVLTFVKGLMTPIDKSAPVAHNATIINKVFSELREPKNEVRNRMLQFATRSEDTILPIQKVY